MSPEVAHRSRWRIFEVIVGLPWLAGIALDLAMPLALPGGVPRAFFITGGVALALAGGALVVRARREFSRRGQPTDPGLPTTGIVTTGVFSVSRNPLYLGGVGVLAGIAVALDLPWALMLLVPAVIACHYLLIRPEERYLAARFGDEYRSYAASVHRWFGRARRRS